MLLMNNKISIRQLQVLLILDLFGVGVNALPQSAAAFAGQDGWVCVLCATALAAGCAFLVTSVAARFPADSFPDYASALLTKPVGIAISLLFVLKIAVSTAFQLRFFAEIVRETLLPETPFAVVCSLMLLLGAYAAAKGYETRARVAEILIFIVFLPLFFVAATVLTDADFSNLLPVFTTAPDALFRGTLSAVPAFSGLECCLLAYPYLNRRRAARKSVVCTVLLIGFLMAVITAVTVARFGPEELRSKLWPVITMMDATTIPGSFLERQGALIMSFWIVSVFSVANAGLFFSSLLLRDVFKKGKHSGYILLMALILFGFAMAPENIVRLLERFAVFNGWLSALFLFAVPAVLCLAAALKKAGVRT